MKCSFKNLTICYGEIEEQSLFNNQFKVPICEGCYKRHTQIVAAASRPGVNIETLLEGMAEMDKQLYATNQPITMSIYYHTLLEYHKKHNLGL